MLIYSYQIMSGNIKREYQIPSVYSNNSKSVMSTVGESFTLSKTLSLIKPSILSIHGVKWWQLMWLNGFLNVVEHTDECIRPMMTDLFLQLVMKRKKKKKSKNYEM